jgi:DNA (cytosine-5)-methyltransferase 1
MTHGSLFSGIGGFDLAAEWMGWGNIFHCEWNEFGKKVLKHYWPNAISYHDITKTDFTIHRGTIDVLTGGFPCQPYSTAGKRKGKDDERHLWPEMCRAIREINPRWVIGENVLGLVNWNEGLVFHEVQSDLEAAGYEVFPYVLPAVSVNAPHRRDRIFFVAHSKGKGSREQSSADEGWQDRRFDYNGEIPNVADANSNRLEGGLSTNINRQVPGEKAFDEKCIPIYRPGIQFQNFPTVPPVCNGDDGLSNRLDSITFSKWRNESIKAGGNAIVPQVALQIFKTIEAYEATTKT